MERKQNEGKQMDCEFRKDGSVNCNYDAGMIDEPFMGIIYNTMNELSDIWFDFVIDSKDAGEKVKQIRINIKI